MERREEVKRKEQKALMEPFAPVSCIYSGVGRRTLNDEQKERKEPNKSQRSNIIIYV
jgi:hypothetical protein